MVEKKKETALVATPLVAELAETSKITALQFLAIAKTNMFSEPGDATDLNTCVMLDFCQRFGFSPIGDQVKAFIKGGKIHPLVMKGAWTVHVNRKKNYKGFDYEETREETRDGKPGALISLVYYLKRDGFDIQRMPPVRMSEWKRDTPNWRQQPEHMLHVKAFNHMVRTGYGLDAFDEMDVSVMETMPQQEVAPEAQIEEADFEDITPEGGDNYEDHQDKPKDEPEAQDEPPVEKPAPEDKNLDEIPPMAKPDPSTQIGRPDKLTPEMRIESHDHALINILDNPPEKYFSEGVGDKELKAWLGEAFGSRHGEVKHKVGKWGEDCVTRGGGSPQFWHGTNSMKDKPTLTGKLMLDRIRDLFKFPVPGADTGKKEETKTTKSISILAQRFCVGVIESGYLGSEDGSPHPEQRRSLIGLGNDLRKKPEKYTNDGIVGALAIIWQELASREAMFGPIFEAALKQLSPELLEPVSAKKAVLDG